ncbi:hypothetical protein COY07_01525 [Candidatus Peregrinibacteria bacterium CG_4_10_14_0_2_um_filter_43_11]|nr:MAG: hypothetical protein COY07_01525 [Candidatus Peregrinibacteria bacterium CG_4_10_14_0_2_um_filter_43_11]
MKNIIANLNFEQKPKINQEIRKMTIKNFIYIGNITEPLPIGLTPWYSPCPRIYVRGRQRDFG